MRRHIRIGLVLVTLLAVATSTHAQTILYVDENADLEPHDGSSWCHAYLEVYEALAVAGPDTVIRVADGTYLADTTGLTDPREATFQLINGVTLEGGYAGCGAADPDERNIALYETILSGDLLGDDQLNWVNRGDNSYHVVNGSDTDMTAVLDGFTVTAGNADGTDDHEIGGGIVLHGGSPVLANCTFSANWADDKGGAMYVRDPPVEPNTPPHGNPTPRLTGCTFTNNIAGELGGGVYVLNGNLTLTDCTFAGNSSGTGGAMATHGDHVLSRCVFEGNSATGQGGGMRSFFGRVELTDCTFTGNSAGDGGGIFHHGSPVLINCVFEGNTAAGSGGGVSQFNSYEDPSPTLTDRVFRQNSAGGGGGGMYNGSSFSFPVLTGCTFLGNSAPSGGGMYNYRDSPTLTDCDFTGNSATEEGGAMRNVESHPTLTNCAFTANLASFGGAMNTERSSPTVDNCLFGGNFAQYTGGAIDNYDNSDPRLTDCTLTGNAAGIGAGIYCYGCSHPMLINCTITGNSTTGAYYPEQGGGLCCAFGSNPTLTNCLILGNWAADWGGGLCCVWDSSPMLTNCTISGNTANDDGGGVYCSGAGSTPRLANCILWSNLLEQIYVEPAHPGDPVVTYSDVQGGWPGEGNIDEPPSFLGGSSGTWADDGTYDPNTCQVTFSDPSGAWEENELSGKFVNPDTTQWLQFVIVRNTDTTITVWADAATIEAGASWVASGRRYEIYDYHLTAGSPCIDAADNTALPADAADLDGDGDTGEPIPVDLDGHARILCEVVDMGAYEFGIGDYNCDQVVDLGDFNHWPACMTGPDKGLYEPGCSAFDFNYDLDVDLVDFAGFQVAFAGPP